MFANEYKLISEDTKLILDCVNHIIVNEKQDKTTYNSDENLEFEFDDKEGTEELEEFEAEKKHYVIRDIFSKMQLNQLRLTQIDQNIES